MDQIEQEHVGAERAVEVNGRWYPLPLDRARVIICLDGSDPSYFDDALQAGVMPTLARWRRHGTYALAEGALPTFTNPNNVSLVCGVPPAVHGIAGNHFYDRALGRDVPMNERAHLRVPTILEALSGRGVAVLSVTAKHKLVKLLHAGDGARAFSSEEPGELGRALVPKTSADVYSAEASWWVLDAGVAALERGLAQLLYLSTTDYVQHKHAPGAPEARAFYAGIDRRLAQLDALGAIVALTADHGMNDETRPDGSPNVVYLRPVLAQVLGGDDLAHVTLPITDPYVVHHGALGGCAMVYLLGGGDAALATAERALAATPGVEVVLRREAAASAWALPADRIGDLVVFAARGAVLGKSEAEHDLSHVRAGLRSHGSLHERTVPLVMNAPLPQGWGGRPLVSWDVFELALRAALTTAAGPAAGAASPHPGRSG